MSATSKHYTALYNVVTDLLMYQDPEHRHRSDRVDSFVFALDREDRDPQRLIMDLFSLQQSIRSLEGLQRGYEANVDLLTEEGKGELFKIRTDLLEAIEQLFTVFSAISVHHAREDARAALKSAARMDVRLGGVAWHMLRDDLKPLVKLDIEGTLYSYLRNKDGSTDIALAIGDLSALNSNPEALYPEVMVRYEASSAARRKIVSRLQFGLADIRRRTLLLLLAGLSWLQLAESPLFVILPSTFILSASSSKSELDMRLSITFSMTESSGENKARTLFHKFPAETANQRRARSSLLRYWAQKCPLSTAPNLIHLSPLWRLLQKSE